MHRKNRSSSRRGFTLIELLAVIAIIALMASLLTGAVQRVRVTQMVHASEDVVSKLQAGVDIQVQAVADMAKNDRRTNSLDFQKVKAFCDNDDDRTEALLTYVRLRQSLPFSLAHATGPTFNGLNFTAGATTIVAFPEPAPFVPLNGMGGSGDVDRVSAAFMYVALSQRTQLGNTFASDEATSGAQIDITLNGVNCRVYKDAWGNPIGYRLVSSLDLPELASAPYTKQGREFDPFDPIGKLSGWTNLTNKNLAQSILGVQFDNRNKVMVVYSGGPPPVATPINLTANGTILGYRLRSIGQRGSK